MNNLVKRQTVEELVVFRNECIEKYKQSQSLIVEVDHIMNAQFCISTGDFPEKDSEAIRKRFDKPFWFKIFKLVGLDVLMDSKRINEFEAQLYDNPPEFTFENVWATVIKQLASSDEIFTQSVVTVFENRRFKYKSHEPQRFGKKLIIQEAFPQKYSYLCHHVKDRLHDLDRVVHLIDGKQVPQYGQGLLGALAEASKFGQSSFDITTDHYRLKRFKNGNLHITILDQDIIHRMNLELANHYGKALPKARA